MTSPRLLSSLLRTWGALEYVITLYTDARLTLLRKIWWREYTPSFRPRTLAQKQRCVSEGYNINKNKGKTKDLPVRSRAAIVGRIDRLCSCKRIKKNNTRPTCCDESRREDKKTPRSNNLRFAYLGILRCH